MKKIRIVVLLILLFIGLIACEGQVENVEKITIYDFQNSSNTLEIEEEEAIKLILESVNSAQKVAGIVNMADPEYRIELGERTYFLRIDEKSGTIMNTVDTHTIYTLADSSIKELYELIQELYKK